MRDAGPAPGRGGSAGSQRVCDPWCANTHSPPGKARRASKKRIKLLNQAKAKRSQAHIQDASLFPLDYPRTFSFCQKKKTQILSNSHSRK